MQTLVGPPEHQEQQQQQQEHGAGSSMAARSQVQRAALAAVGRAVGGAGAASASASDIGEDDYVSSDDESSSTVKKARLTGGAASGEGRVVQRWTSEEHALLARLVEQFGGDRRWSKIAEHIPGRTGKQCRERWLNHLKPNIRRGGWTTDEEQALCYWHSVQGSHWSKIVKKLPGRTENHIKNHWNSAYRSKSAVPRPGVLGTYVANLRRGMEPPMAYLSMLHACGRMQLQQQPAAGSGGAAAAGAAPDDALMAAAAAGGQQALAALQHQQHHMQQQAPSVPLAGVVVASAPVLPLPQHPQPHHHQQQQHQQQHLGSSNESSPAMVLLGATMPAAQAPQLHPSRQPAHVFDGRLASPGEQPAAQQHPLVQGVLSGHPMASGPSGGDDLMPVAVPQQLSPEGGPLAVAAEQQGRSAMRQRAAALLSDIQRMASATLAALEDVPEAALLDPSHIGWHHMRAEMAAVNAVVAAEAAADAQLQQDHQKQQHPQIWRQGSAMCMQPLHARSAGEPPPTEVYGWGGAVPPLTAQTGHAHSSLEVVAGSHGTYQLFRSRSAPAHQLMQLSPPDAYSHPYHHSVSINSGGGGSSGHTPASAAAPLLPYAYQPQHSPPSAQQQMQQPAHTAAAAADQYFSELLVSEPQHVHQEFLELLSPHTAAALNADLADWHG